MGACYPKVDLRNEWSEKEIDNVGCISRYAYSGHICTTHKIASPEITTFSDNVFEAKVRILHTC